VFHWLPPSGLSEYGREADLSARVRHAILPTLTLGLIQMASFMRFTRSSLLEVLRQDYVRTARAKGLGGGRVVWRHALRNALIPVVAVMLVAGSLAPVLAPQSYSAQSLLNRLKPPSATHWLGTDGFGRDVLSRVIWGSRVSLEIGLVATTLALVVGTAVGSIAGYFGGATDTAIMRAADVFL